MMDRRIIRNAYTTQRISLGFMLGLAIGSFLHLEESVWWRSLIIVMATVMFHLSHCGNFQKLIFKNVKR